MNRVSTCFSGVEDVAEFFVDTCVDFLIEFVGRADELPLGYADGECGFFCECEVAPELRLWAGAPSRFFCVFPFPGGFVELRPGEASHFGCDAYVDGSAVVVCCGVGYVVVDGYGGVGRCVVDRREEVVAG